jgi:hypothetical protein
MMCWEERSPACCFTFIPAADDLSSVPQGMSSVPRVVRALIEKYYVSKQSVVLEVESDRTHRQIMA